MPELLRDPIWQFVGVAISFVALVVAIVAVRFQWLRKSLACSSTVERPAFFLFDSRLKDRLKISFDGEPIQHLSTLDICIYNDGNVAIAPSDFVAPITVTFPEELRVFAHSIIQKNPANLPIEVKRDGNVFLISPLLLNSDDEFTLQFLADAMARPVVEARITGVKELIRRPYRNRLKHRLSYYAYRASPVLVFLAMIILGVLSSSFYAGFKQLVSLLAD